VTHLPAPQAMSAEKGEGVNMKIAAVSEDGFAISQHFGRAPYFVVLTIEEGQIADKEIREKAGHHTFAAHISPTPAPDERHGYEAGADVRHASMVEAIQDCQVLIAGGMGWGAYEAMQGYGIEPIVTDVKSIYEAVLLYLKGKLPNLMERLH
jgi:predicted Fe-Mo cluster-binding NifX family protein